MIRLYILSALFLVISCSSETNTERSESKPETKRKEEVIQEKIEFSGTPKEVGRKILDHFYAGMNAKDLDKTCQVLHSEVVYMDVFKGFEKVKKHLQKTFDNRDLNWLTLKEVRFEKADENEIIIYTLETDAGGLGDNYGYYKMVKEDRQFRLVSITIPNEEVPTIFQKKK